MDMHHVNRTTEENYRAIAYLKDQNLQTSEHVSNLREKHEMLDQAVIDHLSTYQKKIASAVENREKCQSGFVDVHPFPGTLSSDTRVVHFNPPFRNTPTIVVGTTHIDAAVSSNIRFNVYVKESSRTGFTVAMDTWADTVLYWLGVRWMACPN